MIVDLRICVIKDSFHRLTTIMGDDDVAMTILDFAVFKQDVHNYTVTVANVLTNFSHANSFASVYTRNHRRTNEHKVNKASLLSIVKDHNPIFITF